MILPKLYMMQLAALTQRPPHSSHASNNEDGNRWRKLCDITGVGVSANVFATGVEHFGYFIFRPTVDCYLAAGPINNYAPIVTDFPLLGGELYTWLITQDDKWISVLAAAGAGELWCYNSSAIFEAT